MSDESISSKLIALATVAALGAAPIAAQTLDSEIVASGLSGALFATSPKNDFDRIFIVQQGGQIRIARPGTTSTSLFMTVNGVVSGGERGLLGLAFHPDYANNGFFYVNYTRSLGGGDIVVSRFSVNQTNPDLGDPTSEVVMVGPINQTFSNHNGGCVNFGPDGFLYIGMGDGGGGGDTLCNAQRGSSLLGKMLRVDVDMNPNGPAVAPASNPFVGNPTFNDLIWAYGLRNPWRFTFDRETGDMWIGDVGQNALEELNFRPGTSTGGENYGWKIMEGTNCFGTSGCTGVPLVGCNSPTLTDPIRTLPNGPNISIVAGYVYRGLAIPSLRGTFFHTDVGTGVLESFRYDFPTDTISELTNRTSEVGAGGGIRSFGEDASGEILIVSSGTVRRIIRDGGVLTNTDIGAGSVGSDGNTPVLELLGRFDTGDPVTIRLRNTLPSAPAVLFFGGAANPAPLPFPGFGTLVPLPIAFQAPFSTNADGIATLTLPVNGGILTLVHQAIVLDLPIGGVTLSNALSTIFFQTQPPVINGVNPQSAAVGATVTIGGQSFATGATLTVGGTTVTPTSATNTNIQFAMPAGVPCDSSVTVTNPDGQFATASFNPTPNVNNTFNGSGPAAGGTNFIIIGSGFSAGTTVTVAGSSVVPNSISVGAIILTTPPGPIGVQPVVITTLGGCTAMTTFTYN